jgi:hypothetical protein
VGGDDRSGTGGAAGGQAGGGASAAAGQAGGGASAAGGGPGGAPSGQAGGGAGTKGGAGAGGATGSGGGAAAGGVGGAGGQSVHLVTFAFTGHITMVIGAESPTADTTPQVGDPFTGSYTFDANATPFPGTGTFLETTPGIAADLEVHNLAFSFPAATDIGGSTPYCLIEAEPTLYSLIIEPFAVTPSLGDSGGMHLYWNLSDPIEAVPAASELSTVPPVLSNWTQVPTAVSIELQETSDADYTANGVMDTIEAR